MAAQSGLNIQIDTGSSELSEIVRAVDFLESQGCNSIIIHQCPSGYPARIPSICLNMIKTLRDSFPKYPIAYSDHTPEADMDIVRLLWVRILLNHHFQSLCIRVEYIFVRALI